MVIAPRQQSSPRRATECRRVKAVVAQAFCSELVHGRRGNTSAELGKLSEARVVDQDLPENENINWYVAFKIKLACRIVRRRRSEPLLCVHSRSRSAGSREEGQCVGPVIVLHG